MTRFHDKYKLTRTLGRGCFGTVHEAEIRQTVIANEDTLLSDSSNVVAVKLIPVGSTAEGLPRAIVREICAMQCLQRYKCLPRETDTDVQQHEILSHPNVVKLIEVMPMGSNIAIITERCDTNLAVFLRDHFSPLEPMSMGMVRNLFRQILMGLRHCHEGGFDDGTSMRTGIMHRDIKTSNILVVCDAKSYARNGTMQHDNLIAKLSDFGLSRPLENLGGDGVSGHLTYEVATRWYRPPELLLGAKAYDGVAVDMWGAGCILFELLAGSGCVSPALFPGVGDIDQMARIFNLLGTPTHADEYPSIFATPDWGKIDYSQNCSSRVDVREALLKLIVRQSGCESAVDLLVQLLAVEPSRRPTAAQCLNHTFVS